MSFRIYLSSPDIGINESKHLKKVFESNWITTQGEAIDDFEYKLEQYLKQDTYVATLNSGTSALHLALILAGVSSDHEVICPTMSFVATANPILYQNATPVFIDSEKDTWNMDPNVLKKAIVDRLNLKKKVKAIVVAHSYGMPANIDAITNIAKQYNITIIEDAAAALGSMFNGQKCGTFGDFGVISFNGNKIITTSSGGALISKNEEDKDKAISLATQAKAIKEYYEHSKIGFNYRMSNVLAGLGLGQMEILDKHIESRRNNHKFYKELFESINGVSLLEEPNRDYYSNHWLTCILINKKEAGFSNAELKTHLEQNNIESRYLWNPLHLQPLFRRYPYYGENVAETLFDSGLCLPSGSSLSNKDLSFIKDTILSFIKTRV